MLCNEEVEDLLVAGGYEYADDFECACFTGTDPPSGCLAVNPAGGDESAGQTIYFNVCPGASSSADLLGLHL